MAQAKTYRPEQLAATLGISGKTIRGYLRKTYPQHVKGTTWVLSAKQAADTTAYFKKRNPDAYAKAQRARAKQAKPRTSKPQPATSTETPSA